MNDLLPWERATLPARELLPTAISRTGSRLFGIIIFLSYMAALVTLHPITAGTVLALVAGLLLCRMMVLDLRYLVLPNVYTALLFVLGLAHVILDQNWQGPLFGLVSGLLFPLLFIAASRCVNKPAFLGGGDLKLMAAAGLWTGYLFFGYLTLACLMSLGVLTVINPKGREMLPFGPGLCLALMVVIILS